MTTPIPASGYPSNTSRTDAEMQTYFETMLSITKEQLGGTGEAASVALSAHAFTPGNNACVCVIDTSGGGSSDTLNSITATNVRDGEVIIIRTTSNARVITIANGAGGAGQIFTGDGSNIVMSSTKLFVALKYNASITAFEEVFRTFSPASGFTNPMTAAGDTIYGGTSGAATRLAGNTTTSRNFLRQTGTGSASAAPAWDTLQSSDVPWGSPGAIGGTSASSGTFTSLALTGTVAAHSWLGNNTGSAAVPSFQTLTASDLPSSVVTASGNLSPLFTSSVASQSISYTLSNAAAGSLFGNFTGSSGAPSYNAAGSADTLLGVAHTGGGLEYKSLTAGSGVTVTAAAGSITVANAGVTSAVAGSGISVSAASGAVTISNSGVTANVAGTGISVSSSTGSSTISLSTPVSVANGGTNATSLAGNGVLAMNSGGTAATSIAPGTTGNVLTSNGTSWVSQAGGGGGGSSYGKDFYSYTFFGGL